MSDTRAALLRPTSKPLLNLVPMVDIRYLMLLFFKLGTDMGKRELEDVVLPAATSVRTDRSDDSHQSGATVSVFHGTPRGAT